MPINVTDYFDLARKIALDRGARRWTQQGMAVEDTEEFGQAMLGLAQAYVGFKPELGVKFITYAYYAMQNEITKRKVKRKVDEVNGVENFESIDQSKSEILIKENEEHNKLILQKILDRIPDTQRWRINKTILIEYFLENKNLGDICKQFGINRERTRQRKEDMLDYIRRNIVPELGMEP